MDHAMSSYYSTGFINIRAIKQMISNYEKFFRTLDPKIKKILRSDWEIVKKKLSDEQLLMENIDNLMMLKSSKKTFDRIK